MTYDNIVVLIPCHSLEDFPSELAESEAAGLLNAFAVAWHPVLLAEAGVMPTWDRADEPPEELKNRLFIVPTICDDWLPGGWVDYARSEGAVVVDGLTEREDLLQAALGPLREAEREAQSGEAVEEESDASGNLGVSEPDPDLAADFLALGSCYLQVELLTRQMHYFSNLDEAHLQREAVAAAEAALAHDGPAARSRLRACFETLTEARERFYPVDCYLVDLCLLIPRLADEHLARTLATGKPVNFLATAEDLEKIAGEKPELIEALRQAWDGETAEVAGGEWREGPAPLLSVASVLWQFERGRRAFRRLFGRAPTTWGRRRFGFSTLVPQVLHKFGYHSALHVALDDGIYPDAEQSKIRWEGCDGSAVDAITRIPLAADSAISYLRFALRMAESMEQDQVAALLLARWPEVKAPWFEDFRRMHDYSHCLGRFVTLNHFFEQTDAPGRLSKFEAWEYLSPFLLQAVARQEPNPVSRFADHLLRRQHFDAGCWYRSVSAVLMGDAPECDRDDADSSADSRSSQEKCEELIEEAGPDAAAEANGEVVERAEAALKAFVSESARQLAEVVMSGAGDQPGFLLLNPLSFSRRVSVDLPALESPPPVGGAIKAVQFDDARKTPTVEVPPSGFVWIPADAASGATTVSGGKMEEVSTAEEHVLRNEFFEVYINETTGGIAEIKGYGRSPNRLSQQVAFRFPRERALAMGDEGDEVVKSYYSEMRRLTSEITCAGPALGELVTSGDIVDQEDGAKLAGFRQTVRVWRARRIVELDLELDIERMPAGDPWSNYYAVRFAWNDSTASLTRSVQQGAHGFRGERFESPHAVEIATEDQRTTILPQGLPFHRKTGPRMLDSLLVTAGETRRRFRFVIALDEDYPMQAALDTMTPTAVVPTSSGPPRVGTAGWFFHLNAKNVQILRVMGLDTVSADEGETWARHDRPALPAGPGFALRLIETEGRNGRVRLRCFKAPTAARQRNFEGRPLAELRVEEDCVLIETAPYEITDVELQF